MTDTKFQQTRPALYRMHESRLFELECILKQAKKHFEYAGGEEWIRIADIWIGYCEELRTEAPCDLSVECLHWMDAQGREI